jgi:hypothetical protein
MAVADGPLAAVAAVAGTAKGSRQGPAALQGPAAIGAALQESAERSFTSASTAAALFCESMQVSKDTLSCGVLAAAHGQLWSLIVRFPCNRKYSAAHCGHVT